MSTWTTRSLERDHNYIVFQHTLKGVNHTVNGIKFRDGYAVVEKDSKTYFALKKIPVLKAAKEYPLLHLRKLPFITRTSDIRTVYGQDVYAKFVIEAQLEVALAASKIEEQRELELKAKQDLTVQLEEAKKTEDTAKVEEIKAAMPVIVNCCHRTHDGTLCKNEAVDFSPSNHCEFHILEDPRLSEMGIETKKFFTKAERKDFRHQVKNALKKAKSQGKF